MKKITILHIILIMLTILALTSIAADGGRRFTTTLTGAAEAPGPGDPDGSGTATVWLNHGQGRVCWEIQVFDVAPISAAHIHVAPEGSPGPVVVPLFPPLPDASGFSSGCMENVDRDLIKDIIQNPQDYYINVHNADFQPGALRGQLSK
jgi:hypothetical protein